jgi:hypothetical protein
VEHGVDGLVDRDELDAVVVPEVECLTAQALDVLEAARIEVVEADDPPVAGEQVLAQVRPEEAGSAGYDCSAHAASVTDHGGSRLPP